MQELGDNVMRERKDLGEQTQLVQELRFGFDFS